MPNECKGCAERTDNLECLPCRLAYWRSGGRFPGVKYEHGGEAGRRLFHDTTIKTEQKRAIEDAAKQGIEAVPYHSIWGH